MIQESKNKKIPDIDYGICSNLLSYILKYKPDIESSCKKDDLKNFLELFIRDTTRENKLIITIYKYRNKIIIEHMGCLEPIAFNLSSVPELFCTYHFDFNPDDLNLDKVSKTINTCLNKPTRYSEWIEAGNPSKIKARQCDISELHEREVVYEAFDTIDQLKDKTITFLDKTTIYLQPYYLHHIKQINNTKPVYLVINLRREVFIYTETFFNNFFTI